MNTQTSTAFEQFTKNDKFAHICLEYAHPAVIEFAKSLEPQHAYELETKLRIGNVFYEAFTNARYDDINVDTCKTIVYFLRRGLNALMISGKYNDLIQMKHDAIAVDNIIEAFELIDKLEREAIPQVVQKEDKYMPVTNAGYIDYSSILQELTPPSYKPEKLETAA